MGFMSDRHVGNTNYTQVEPLITVEQLRKTYLFGVDAIDHDGRHLSDEALQTFINNAVSLLEHDLDLAVMPRHKEEHKDYFANDYYEWGFMQLNNFPVISIESIDIVYLRDNQNLEVLLNIPTQWIRLDPDTGLVRLIPNNRFPGRLAVGSGGAFFPELFNRHATVPNLWVVHYTHGFKEGCVPSLLNAAIGLIASNFYLNIAGDLILGRAGIAGASLSIDGLSQSIQTTASAENNGFSARLKDNLRQLYGDRTLGAPGILQTLRAYYKGAPTMII